MSGFDRDFNRAIKDIDGAIEKAIRATAIQLFTEIITRSPVDTGRFRSNWQTSLRRPDTTITNGIDASVTSQMTSAVRRYNLSDDSIWFSNNLPYADRIEHGWSEQAPTGMVRTSVKMFKPLIESIARIEKI